MRADLRPEAAPRPIGIARMADAVEPKASRQPVPGEPRPGSHHAPVVPIHERLTWGIDDVSALTGLSRRALERLRSAGRLPQPDLTVNRRVLWLRQTITTWLERGGC